MAHHIYGDVLPPCIVLEAGSQEALQSHGKADKQILALEKCSKACVLKYECKQVCYFTGRAEMLLWHVHTLRCAATSL